MWSLRSTAQGRITAHGTARALGSFLFLFVVFMVFVVVFPVVLLPVFLFFNAKRSELR